MNPQTPVTLAELFYISLSIKESIAAPSYRRGGENARMSSARQTEKGWDGLQLHRQLSTVAVDCACFLRRIEDYKVS